MRDNINMVIKWNDAGDKAVLLVSYGTKGDAVFIYEQRPTGRFERLKFSPPNPLSLYKKKTGHALAEADMPGEDQDGLGHWLNDHEITMLSGLSKDTLKPGTDSIGLFATYNASIVDCKVVCSDIILVGPLPQNKWISFVDKWTHSNK